MRKIRVFYGVLILLSMSFMSLALFAQSTAGSINGTITDPSGALLPGVEVTLVNLGTGHETKAMTNSGGTYNFRELPPGTYSVQAEVNGFSAQKKTGLELFANQALTADIQMKVSGTRSRVIVSAVPSLMDTRSSNLSDVLPSSALLKMPVLTRQCGACGIVGTLYFMPGAQNPSNVDSSGYPAINGISSLDTMATMDGMVVMANLSNIGGGPVQPGEEAVQEIHTVLANAPAEFWRPAAVTVVTKSGTNQLHGSLYEDYNGAFMNSKSFFATSVPPRVENNFAASIGGPIKKNKLFYFGDYEGGRNSTDAVLVANVPLPAWRTGDFSSLSQSLINPYTGTPFLGNKIPANMISPVAQNIQSVLWPLPNFGPPGLMSGNFRELLPSENGWDVFDLGDASLNYIMTKKDTLFLRESYRHLRVQDIDGSLPAVSHEVENRLGASGVISETHIFSPILINQIRFGYTDQRLAYHQVFDGYDFITKAGMTGPFVGDNSVTAVPWFTISSIESTTNLDDDRSDVGIDYEWNDNLSWTRGKHLLKFGIDQILDHLYFHDNFGNVYGSYSFNGAFTTNGYADFLLGLPQQTSVATPIPPIRLRGTMIGVYAQDQFQVSPRLTLTYGLRWEFQGPYAGAPYVLYSFDPKNGKMVIPTQAGFSHVSPFFPSNIPIETASQAGYPSGSLLFSHYLNFYPRVGFAFLPFHKTNLVLRGAYGLYGNNIYASAGLSQATSGGPFAGTGVFINSFTNGAPAFSFPHPFLSSSAPSTQTVSAIDPQLKVPYTEQWNLTAEQSLGSGAAVTLAYVGTASRNLLLPMNLNQPPPSTTPFSTSEITYPNYIAVNWTENAGVDNYNSLQISFREILGKTLFLDTGFTWSRDLTDDQLVGNYEGASPQNRFCLACEYGNNLLTQRLYYYVNGHYLLPVGRGQRYFSSVNRWWNRVIGGWALAGNGTVGNGEFFTPTISSGFDTANTNTSFNQRPDQIGDPHVAHPSINNWFNINAFAIPGCPTSDPLCTHSVPADVGRFGNVRPGTLVGPKLVEFDLALMKNFQVTRRGTFQLRLAAQNAFNHPNFGLPDAAITDGPGVAGIVTSLANAGNGPREVDIMGRFTF